MVLHPAVLPPSLLRAHAGLQPSSLTLALAACLSMAILYVASLYLLPASIRLRHRDDPLHIKARFVSVIVACLLSIRIFLLFASPSPGAGLPIYVWLGLTGWNNPSVFLPLLAIVCLFLGPITVMIAECYYDRWYELVEYQSSRSLLYHLSRRTAPSPRSWLEWVDQRRRRHGQGKDVLWRNLVVAPLTEARGEGGREGGR
ncbi:hypothetical protein Naga_100696g2, partial [Nannochloropsis gaditana]